MPPPRGELFLDPRLRLVWAAIEQLDEGDKHLLLDELREQVALHNRPLQSGGPTASARDR